MKCIRCLESEATTKDLLCDDCRQGPPPADPVDADTFKYDGPGGFSQCISGMGRNTVELIKNTIDEARTDPEKWDGLEVGRINWHVMEIVRWCQNLNLELKTLKQAKEGH